MLRKAMLGLAMGGLAAMAQAVTIPWETVTATDADGYVVTHKGGNTDRAIKLSFTLSGAPTAGCLLVYGYTNNGAENGGIHLYYADGALKAEMEYNQSGSTSAYTTLQTPTLKEGANEIAIAMQRNGYNNTSSVFINGVECFSLYRTGQGGFDWSHVLFGEPFNETDTLKPLAGATLSDLAVAEAYDVTIQDIRDAYAALPEPTALALLALGVAGVALRRRVA